MQTAVGESRKTGRKSTKKITAILGMCAKNTITNDAARSAAMEPLEF